MSSFAGGSREILLESPGEVRGALAEESRENIPTGVPSYQPEASLPGSLPGVQPAHVCSQVEQGCLGQRPLCIYQQLAIHLPIFLF